MENTLPGLRIKGSSAVESKLIADLFRENLRLKERIRELESATNGFGPPEYFVSKPKPRWDVHLQYIGDWAGILAEILRPLIAGRCGSDA